MTEERRETDDRGAVMQAGREMAEAIYFLGCILSS